jgi:hypothetical protein
MDIKPGDILTMKKKHPCGESRWLALRVGADFKLRCLGCGREIMDTRQKLERGIKGVEKK